MSTFVLMYFFVLLYFCTFALLYFCTFVLFVLLYFVIWLDCPYELPCKIWSLQLKQWLRYEYFCTYVLFCTFVLFLFGNGCGRSRSTCMQNLGLLARKMAELLDQVRKRTLIYIVLCLQGIILSKLKSLLKCSEFGQYPDKNS